MTQIVPRSISQLPDYSGAKGSVHDRGGICSRLSLAGLPSIPRVLIRLLELFQDEEASVREIAACIEQDVAMTARIFSIASSASQHGRQTPASLEQCVTMLGMSTVKTIVINESIFQVFRRLANEKEYDLGHFWAHSLRCALLARALAKASGQSDPAEAYLGGLLHDVGQLALLTADPANYLSLFLTRDDPDALCHREQAEFDVTHAEVGAWLVEKWNLDSLLADCVLYHHDRIERLEGAHPLIRCVHFADHLAFLQGNSRSLAEADLSGYRIPNGLDLPQLIERTEREMGDLARQLGIDTSSRGVGAGQAGDSGRAKPGASASNDLAEKVRDIVLLGNALDPSAIEPEDKNALEAIIRALKIVFDIDAALCFLPEDAPSGRFVAHALTADSARFAGISFVPGQGGAEVSRAPIAGIRMFNAEEKSAPTVLDDQLLRAAGKPGVIYLPLRDGEACQAVLVAGVDLAQQAALRQGRMLCLQKFIGTAGRFLAERLIAEPLPASPVSDDPAADRRRLQQLVHEVGNPLSVIHNYLALLEHKFIERDIDRRELLIVTEEIERLSRIIRSATDDRREGTASATVDLNALIEDLVELCRPTAQPFDCRIEVVTDLDPDIEVVSSHGDLLRQLILNLLKNAIEALSVRGGTIRVSTRPWTNAKGPQFTEICIEDSGPGLPSGVLDRLYQPVASSKGSSHQGIGLAIVGQLVRELDGLINCRSSTHGTCFQILLPHHS